MTNNQPNGTYECDLKINNKTVSLTFKASSVELALKLFTALQIIVSQLQKECSVSCKKSKIL
jgi:hypothetical protein